MAELRAHAEVLLFGETVGAVVELEDGRILFEFADSFRRRGLEISPIHLPTSLRGPVAFDELRRSPAFEGLPGVLADALPDSFGNRVIRAYFAARGDTARALSPVQRLLYVGERALGALTFQPAEAVPVRPAELESLELAALVRDARRIIEGDHAIAIPEIYRMSASAGGMRPKALVLFDPHALSIRSGHAAPRPGEIACLLKFDGVGDGSERGDLRSPRQFNRIEAAYTQMARAGGVKTADVTLLDDGERAHLLVHRFDIVDGVRLHQHSLGGLAHVDYNEPGASSYEEYLRAILGLGMPYSGLEEAYRRLLFNVLAVNQDDHVKNLSFHMDREGAWSLAPAYDLTFAKGRGFTARHQMRVRDKLDGLRAADLLAVGDEFGINDPAALLRAMRGAVARWEEFARGQGVTDESTSAVRKDLDEREDELGR